TKMGLVPVHTWLPDAHSEAPTPISALLSAALLAVCFYAILRYYQITERAVGPGFPRAVLLGFGLASLVLAALAVAVQRDLKRLLAYSSVEHMGVMCIGMSFAAPLAIVGVLLHVLAHAAAKGSAFFGAGSVVRKFGSKDLHAVRGGATLLPFSGPLLVLAVLALSAMPPFGIFRSEFMIVSGGLATPGDAAPAVLVVLVTVAAMGLTWYVGQTMLSPPPSAVPLDAGAVAVEAPTRPSRPARGETSWWIVAAMVIGLAGLVLLGVHPPAPLSVLLRRAAFELRARP
ncbi:MAG: proton-conducting transporter transmembrane domain-containing protein, partial [Acidimicrobiales bacterium]